MDYIFLPVTADGHLYSRDDNILNHTPCIILSQKELEGLRALLNRVKRYGPCPVIGEMLKYPREIPKSVGSRLKAGDYIVYLHEGLSPQAKTLIQESGCILTAYILDIIRFECAVETLEGCRYNSKFCKEFKEEIKMVDTLFEASMPYCYELGMI